MELVAGVICALVSLIFIVGLMGRLGSRATPIVGSSAPNEPQTPDEPDMHFGSWLVRAEALRPVFGGGHRHVLMGHRDSGGSGIAFSASKFGFECAIWPPEFRSEQVEARITVRGLSGGETIHRGICQERGTPMVLAPELENLWSRVSASDPASEVELLVECGSYQRELALSKDGFEAAVREWRTRVHKSFPALI